MKQKLVLLLSVAFCSLILQAQTVYTVQQDCDQKGTFTLVPPYEDVYFAAIKKNQFYTDYTLTSIRPVEEIKAAIETYTSNIAVNSGELIGKYVIPTNDISKPLNLTNCVMIIPFDTAYGSSQIILDIQHSKVDLALLNLIIWGHKYLNNGSWIITKDKSLAFSHCLEHLYIIISKRDNLKLSSSKGVGNTLTKIQQGDYYIYIRMDPDDTSKILYDTFISASSLGNDLKELMNIQQ